MIENPQYTGVFVGIPLPDVFIGDLVCVQDQIVHVIPGLRIVKPKYAHLTVFRIGSLSNSELIALEDSLRAFLTKNSFPDITVKGLKGSNQSRFLSLEAFPDDFLRGLRLKIVEDYSGKKVSFPKKSYPHLTLSTWIRKDTFNLILDKFEIIEDITSSVDWTFPIQEMAIYGKPLANPRVTTIIARVSAP
ncbi:MAG: hypothetical protein ACD_30C00052G0007 [uncultured bacterium]|uniref:2'-5' RNA ligase n=4 Tax=Candidatus Daviesiibacteriota TaxID=1752718 RepID=A0A0G0F6R1_9BACT|nr:MAG: hypothetical protein ACD_30C00052G0007 [uncultured bacterium]KKQ09190.1 MAG: hypothetical protein US19_C0016G0013 [Candidatus Daviesbacteria bacterium GW2011_GWB1_36_5]KKQ14788.1 MAG: hypothetical protein US28_C0029G0013 [Candidatus Daviesbacteria bacterium GW2011_GWA1_36_8]OGE16424.1 MAG: hypothetical protein A2858_01650 [Candidatus Daviesbacteria bacterium RIFCSPHIGHO2_01_FULL_36_37]OGE35328.1 MAG: hypothetical protein A3E66_00545 [Candidatus Daviesbacteria bacterium RIFCSPHIGHO2_12_F